MIKPVVRFLTISILVSQVVHSPEGGPLQIYMEPAKPKIENRPKPYVAENPPFSIPVWVTHAQHVEAQTDSTPWIGSCGLMSGAHGEVAVSRDLFFREDGSKRCGEKIVLKIGKSIGVYTILDTMAKSVRGKPLIRYVDIYIQNDVDAMALGKKRGFILAEEE